MTNMPMRWLPAALTALLLAGCGATSPTAPTPTPPVSTSAPPTPQFTGTVTETLTGAPVQGWSALVSGSRVTISAPGYVPRETRTSATRIDLIREAGFDIAFYRQLARGAMDGSVQPLRVLSEAPSLYLQTSGLSAANTAALEQAARTVVPALTGGVFQVQRWETGVASRPETAGWIIVDVVSDDAGCGRAHLGRRAGHVWLNITARCRYGQHIANPGVFAHELGHALGFSHVDRAGSLMKDGYLASMPSDLERHHAAIAYARQAGSRDIDIDP